MAEFENIVLEQRGSMAVITLNRPEDRNPMDRATVGELTAVFQQCWSEPSVRSIAVTGAGKAFCAGGDLRQMGKFSTMPTRDAFEWPEPIVLLNRAMLNSPKPVVAAVNGPAYAGGMGLAGMCDLILATPEARFAMPEVKIGIFPMIIVAQLSRSLPRKLLMEMMFTGEPLSAADAHRVGFINRLYDSREDMMTGLLDYAARFEQASPDAIRLGRRTFEMLSTMSADQALEASQFFVMPFHLGADITEGADAFLNRRSPSWVEAARQPADRPPGDDGSD